MLVIVVSSISDSYFRLNYLRQIFRFFNQVLALVKSETDEALEQQKNKIAVEPEIRRFTTSTSTVSMYKYLPNTPEWLHSDTMQTLEKAKQLVVSRLIEAEQVQEHNKDHVAFTSLHPPESDLVKSGKFGPDIDEFSMLLPANYPNRAGQQKYALEPVLTLHEKVISKLKTAALPSKFEEVRVSVIFFCVFGHVCLFILH